MRIAVFDSGRIGIVEGVDVFDVCGGDPGPAGPLQSFLDSGRPFTTRGAAVPLSSVRLAAPLPRPPKIIGAPVNYAAHRTEMAAGQSIAELGLFLKASSSVIGPGQAVRLPYTDVRTDQEGELAVVIGRAAWHVPVERALEHVFGYTCALDITVRSTEDRSTRKSFDTFTPLGPWVVTADEVPDPGDLMLRCRVDGELRQEASTRDLLFGVPELIAYASSVCTLWPGDVILTGTPAGVGPINEARSIEVEIERIGRLEVSVDAGQAIPYADRPRAGVGA
ncbi:fumarylacetoacetate hydrolase family protein [Amycolatopsis anabasis]|uniref:fumarylacetoacetate hydrolase family protein n=1 Tax=Amycolatopsis anabasis TaxID=1840409 RepID=UPI00131D1D11|nr:fumarylacetoacetate hydrolase family protein [Amycolatopsis anabasis]